MKGLCPECEHIHFADEPCKQYRCPRCKQEMDHPDDAEGCEDFSCPAQEPPCAAADGAAHDTGETVCATEADTSSPAPVAEASESTAVSPAISPAAQRLQSNGRESPTIETTETQPPHKSGDKSGSQSRKTTPDCYECIYRRDVPGSAHSSCEHPERLYAAKSFMIATLSGVHSDGEVLTVDVGTICIAGKVHGIRHGWFIWPFNFDPTWLVRCSGFRLTGRPE